MNETQVAEVARVKQFNKNKWLFSVGGIGRDMVYQLIASFLMMYIQFGVPLTLTQFTTISLIIGVGGRIWDAINDPMMGAIIENTHMKWGKFKPWILIGALTCGLAIIVMFNVQSLAGWDFVVFMCVMYLLWESTFTMNDIGYWSMLPSLSSEKKERDQVTMLTVLFAGIGAFLAQGIIPFLTAGKVLKAFRYISIGIALAFIGCQLMTSIGVKEPIDYSAQKGEKISIKKMLSTIFHNDQILWITLSMLFYNIGSAMLVAFAANLVYMEIGYNGFLYTVLVAAYGVPSIFINIIYPKISAKLGRRKLQFVSIMVCIAGYIGIGLLGWNGGINIAILAILAAIISMGQSMFYTSSIINMTNCVEYNDYKQGERNEAVVSTLRPFMAKFAGALQVLIVTIVLAASGIFGISQNISTLEAQKGHFDRMNTAQQVVYLQDINSLIDEFDIQFAGLEFGSKEYEAKAEELTKMLEEDDKYSHYKTYQLNAGYIKALKDAKILIQAINNNGDNIYKQAVFIGTLGNLENITADRLQQLINERIAVLNSRPQSERGDEGVAIGNGVVNRYVMTMQLDGENSPADRNFKEKSTLSMRIWLRVSVAVIPIVCLIIAWLVQRKKFIIDEEYYDKMVEAIKERDAKKEIESDN